MFKKLLAFILMLSATMAMAAVDVNKATDAELDGIKGIGPATSKMILSERQKSDFKSWQDLIERVKGLGDARAAKLSAEGLTVGGASYTATAATAPKGEKKPAKTSAKEDAKDMKTASKADSAKPADSTKK